MGMSTYWHVACRTCDETHHFNDANHQDVFMSRVAKLAPLLTSCCGTWRSVAVRAGRSRS